MVTKEEMCVGGGGGGRIKQEFGINIHTTIYTTDNERGPTV